MHPVLAGRPVYLDYNATTPVDPRVVAALLPALTEDFGNPSSTHVFAEAPRRLLARARDRVAALIGAAPDEVVFVVAPARVVGSPLRQTSRCASPPSGPQPAHARRSAARSVFQQIDTTHEERVEFRSGNQLWTGR